MTNLLDIHVILLVVAVVLFTSARKHVSYTLHFSHVPNILLKYKKLKILRLEALNLCLFSFVSCRNYVANPN